MMMRALLLASVVTLGACGQSTAGTSSAASSASSATSSAALPVACGPVSATTLAGGREARVYVQAGTVYGCARGGHGRYVLGRRGSCLRSSAVAPVTVAGRFAAYGLQRCGIDTGSTEVLVRRLTDGRVVHADPASSPAGPEGYQAVNSLVLKADGAVAWIATGRSLGRSASLVEVWRVDRSGTLRRLDSGPAIVTGSLRLHGSTLSWRHGSAPRTALLS